MADQAPQSDQSPEERREQALEHVRDLMVQGFNHFSIARVLGIKPWTAKRYMETVRRRNLAGAEAMNPAQEVADANAFFQAIRAEHMLIYRAEQDTVTRLQALRQAVSVEKQRMDLLSSIGFLPQQLGTVRVEGARAIDDLERAPQPGNVIEAYESAFGPLSPEERRRVVDMDSKDDRVQRAEPPGLPEPRQSVRRDHGGVLRNGTRNGSVAREPKRKQDPDPEPPAPREQHP